MAPRVFPSAEGSFGPDGTLKAPSGSYDDRPITPMRHAINLDDPNIANATPPGLPTSKRQSPSKNGASGKKKMSSKEVSAGKVKVHDGENDDGVRSKEEANDKFEMPEDIPEDADAAETFYSQHEDFESDSEPDVSHFTQIKRKKSEIFLAGFLKI